MRAAVTGASGFVGRHLVAELLRTSTEVTAVVRQTSDTSRLTGARIVVGYGSSSSSVLPPSGPLPPCGGGIGWGVEPSRASTPRTIPPPQGGRGPEIRGAGQQSGVTVQEQEAIERLSAAFTGCDIVYHLAGAVDFGSEWERFRQVNVTGTRNVIAAAQAAGVRRIVHCSSIVAVGASSRPTRLDETARWNLGPLQVPYVNTKREAEDVALAARNIDVVVANPACVIGPGDHAGSEFGTICGRFWRGKLPIHFGGGNNFVDVRDVATGLRLCAERGRAGERYILTGSNRSMTAFFSELALAARHSFPRFCLPTVLAPLTAALEFKLAPRSRHRAYLSPAQAKLLSYFFYFDCGKARRELGYSARPLRESLRDAFNDWKLSRAA
ncbi:MAG: NAD-dependent epimerase/dehydratase family protein [Gemmataceae bacterium]